MIGIDTEAATLKLVVTIPAFNEEKTIAKVIKSVPKSELNDCKIIVIDDGSKDKTAKEAKLAGADLVYRFKENRGLAHAFKKGIDLALISGADLIVNIDGDGQYDSEEIPLLIQPIVEGEADIVLGSRFEGWIEQMPWRKRIGNIFATKVTSTLAGIKISDAQTGFRALSRDAASRLNIMSDYTYTQEMIIQAANKGLRIVEVPCNFSKRKEGESRLMTGIFGYARRAGLTIMRTYRDYKPLRTFLFIGGSMFFIGLLIGLRVLLHFFATGTVTPYLPSAVLTGVLLIIGFQIMVLGLIADMIGTNRRIMEEIVYRSKKKRVEH
jgi:glycosyltransferase involved in cell wall biosynthesis